jgi:hypothetical protein
MKTFLNRFVNRFVATVLLLFLSVMLCFQNAALAGTSAGLGNDGEGGGSPLPSRMDVFRETLTPSVANPVGSEPAPGETIEAFRERTGQVDRRDGSEGAGGRDAEQRERNKESGHKGHGGPQ